MSTSKRERRRAQLAEDRRKANAGLKELREHQEELENQKDEAVDCRSQVLTDHFKKSEANLGKAETIDQALLDAQIFSRLGEYSKRQAAQLQTGLQTYDVKTFTESLVLIMKGGPADEEDPECNAESGVTLNFEDLGNSVWHCWKTIPSIEFMYGNAPEEEEAKARQKKVKKAKKGTVAVKPCEIQSNEVEQTETDRQVAEMTKELERRQECNYWVFVIDPNSFTRSIENVFHSSFLVKDMLAALDLKIEPPKIRYIDPAEKKRAEEGSEENAGFQRHGQFIMGFDRNIWKEVIRKYRIRRCILPSRPRKESIDPQLQRLNALAAEYGEEAKEEDTAAF